MIEQVKNYGVKLGKRRDDLMAGAKVSALPYEVKNLRGDWWAFLPPGEWQKSDDGDSMSCVTFSMLNAIETQEKQQTGVQVNYSDRWIAKMANTSRDGAYLYQVVDAIREFGLVKEESYPAPESYTWDEYHAPIPESLLSKLKAEGQEWLKKWDPSYEWVEVDFESLIKHIKHAPLDVVIPGHAIMNFKNEKDIIHYFDSYEPWLKQTDRILAAMKILLTPNEEAPHPYSVFVDLRYGDSGPHFLRLKKALGVLGWIQPHHDAHDSESYDDAVARRVLAFQKGNLPRSGWSFWWAIFYYKGYFLDRHTRELINRMLSNHK